MTELESAQLRDLRAEFEREPELCEWALAGLGEPPPELERVIVRVRPEDAERGIARALALTVDGVPAEVELTDAS